MNGIEDLNHFLSAVRWERYDGARYASVAYRRGERLYNLHSRITLLPTRFDSKAARSLGHGLWMIRGWLSVDAVRDALKNLEDGTLRLSGQDVQLKHLRDDRTYNWWMSPSFELSRQRVGWSGPLIQGSGPQLGQVTEPHGLRWLADRLVAMRPFRVMTLEDIGQFIGAGVDLSSDSNSALVELFAPICARLEGPAFRPRTKTVEVYVESHVDPLAERMEVLLQPASGGSPIVVPARTWKQGPRRRWRATGSALGMEGRIDLALVASGEMISRSTVVVPVLGARLLSGLDGGETWLRGLLFPTDSKKDSALGFERGIVSLLGLGGIAAIPTGFAGRDRYVDIVCDAGAGQVIVAECTTAAPAPKKLADLRGRTVRVLNRVQRPGEKLRMRSCVFTSLGRSDLPPEIVDEAKKLGVTIIAREEVDALLEAVSAGELGEVLGRMLSPSPDWLPGLRTRRRPARNR